MEQNACSGGGPSGGFGTPFLIVMFVTPAVYLMIGAGLNHRAGQVGIDLIPNLDFWRDVPGLFTDGVGVMVDGAKGLLGKAKGGDGGFSTIS